MLNYIIHDVYAIHIKCQIWWLILHSWQTDWKTRLVSQDWSITWSSGLPMVYETTGDVYYTGWMYFKNKHTIYFATGNHHSNHYIIPYWISTNALIRTLEIGVIATSSYNYISYHIISYISSYHIISYYIISYQISYHVDINRVYATQKHYNRQHVITYHHHHYRHQYLPKHHSCYYPRGHTYTLTIACLSSCHLTEFSEGRKTKGVLHPVYHAPTTFITTSGYHRVDPAIAIDIMHGIHWVQWTFQILLQLLGPQYDSKMLLNVFFCRFGRAWSVKSWSRNMYSKYRVTFTFHRHSRNTHFSKHIPLTKFCNIWSLLNQLLDGECCDNQLADSHWKSPCRVIYLSGLLICSSPWLLLALGRSIGNRIYEIYME